MDIQETIEYFEEEIYWASMSTPSPLLEGIKSEKVEHMEIAVSAMQEFQQYRQIGTVEECWKAMEKQTPKKPTYDGDGYAPDGSFAWDEWLCPNCGARYEVDYDEYSCCPNCGQRIQWEGEQDE